MAADEPAQIILTQLAYSVAHFAKAVDHGETTIREHMDDNKLVARYPSSKAIISAEDGLEWLRGLPTEKPVKRASS